ncbi:MAG: hypothetical protein OJF58_001532 [Enhydrobacter sp.]|jgi:hypothetical protein|nr:MAG: hypothetical protein OJF58_001532 [Enhydrobacter sp.]
MPKFKLVNPGGPNSWPLPGLAIVPIGPWPIMMTATIYIVAPSRRSCASHGNRVRNG